MKKLLLIAISCLPNFGFAQTRQIVTLNLQQAMQIGLQNRFDLKADQYNINLAQNQFEKTKKAWIPEIQAEGSIQYSTQVQPTYVPGGFAGFAEAGLLTFGAKNASVFGLSLNQTIFKPGVNTEIKIAGNNLALQQEKIHSTETEIKSSIATAYLNVLLKKIQYQIAQNEASRFEAYKNLAEGKYHNGTLIENDFLRAKLDDENAKVNTQTAQQNYDLAISYLKYQINLPQQSQLILTDSIGNLSFEGDELQKSSPLENRTEIKQLKLEAEQSNLQIKKMRQSALPTVSFVGYYAQLYQNQNFHYEESQWWAPHSYVGLQFTIPITGNFSNKNNIIHYKLQQQKIAMQMKQEQSEIDFQVLQATTHMQNALQNMNAAKDNYNLSQTIYKNQKQQFKIGTFQYSDLLDTEKSLDKAEQNFIKTIYDYMEASIAYQKAIGAL